MRAVLNQRRGTVALAARMADKLPTLEFLDRVGANVTRAEGALRLLRANIARLQRQLDQAERDASEHKAKRADAVARLQERDNRLRAIEQSAVWKAAKPIWKLTARKRNDRVAPKPPNEDLAFAIDLPEAWATARGVLLIRGWCFSQSGRELAGVRAKIGKKSRIGRYGFERRDIERSFDGDERVRRSGFAVEIAVPRGTSTVRLEAITNGGGWEPFFEHELTRKSRVGDADEDLDEDTVRPLPNLRGITADGALKLLTPRFAEGQRDAPRPAPMFSIITPLFNTKPQWLAEAATTLLDQSFTHWEWCLIDDGSTDRETQKLIAGLDSVSPRLRIHRRENRGISEATNAAIDLARGDFVCFLDHDDLLPSNALELLAEKLKDGFDVVYSDEDKLNDNSRKLVDPFFKPDWSPEYFRGAMYVGHLLCVRREIARKIRFNSEFDGVQDFEFMLRVSETGAKIGHIAEVMYHWRKTPGSIAESGDAKPEIGTLQARAVNAHLSRLGVAAEAAPSRLPHRLQIVPRPRPSYPPISIIIPTKDKPDYLGRCLESIANRTSYPECEVILVDNDTTDPEALRLMEQYPVQRVPFAGPFNFSRANNQGVAAAGGEFLVFLNNDTEIVTEDWLEHLLFYAEQLDVGAAGAMLVYEDETVQHAGVALGIRGTADHLMRGFPLDGDGYAGSLSCAREVSAVTAACMMMRKSLFLEIGGFNEHYFTAYQDLDLCLRLRAKNLRLIHTPCAVVVHHEWVSRKAYYDMVDRMLLLDQWESVIERGDPYYNRNLNLERGDYSLATEHE